MRHECMPMSCTDTRWLCIADLIKSTREASRSCCRAGRLITRTIVYIAKTISAVLPQIIKMLFQLL
jgi:hypothetical protein